MKDERQLSDEQLRLATSRSVPSKVVLDGETAAARDGFLLLGAAVEKAASNFDEAALLARLQKSCMATPVILPQRQELARDWMSLVLAGALAAAGLIAIVRIATDSGTKGVQVAKIERSAQSPAGGAIAAGPSRSMFAWNDSVGWNDSLDDEIALAS